MKKYFILFLLTISTFLAAEEKEQIELISKWQTGKGNFAFGTSLSYGKIGNKEVNIINIGSKTNLENNLLFSNNVPRNLVDLGIFSASSNGTYLAYGLTNNSMLYFSADLFSEIENYQYFIGNNLTASYVYSNKMSKYFEIDVAPYLTLPFIGINKNHNNSYENESFDQPFILGFNFVASLMTEFVFLDFIFNYSTSSEIKTEEMEGEYYYDDHNSPGIDSYAFALYLGVNYKDIFTLKAGFILNMFEAVNHIIEIGGNNQIATELKINDFLKFGITYETGSTSYFPLNDSVNIIPEDVDEEYYDNSAIYHSLTAKVQFIF